MYQASVNIHWWRNRRNISLLLLLSILFILSSTLNVHAGSVTLAWDKNSNTSVIGYKIYYRINNSGEPYNGLGIDQGNSPITVKATALSDSNNPKISLTGLASGSTYYFAATAYAANGDESSYSNEVKFENTADIVNPSCPTGFMGNGLNSSNAFLKWNAAIDTGGSGVAGYDIFRNGQFLTHTSDLGFNDSGLSADTEYRYSVRTKDKAGNLSDLSSEISVKTLPKSNTAVRVNCGGNSYIDVSGNQWQKDFGFNTGRLSSYQDSIRSTQDDVLHQSARWDARDATELSYGFDVPNGNYRINLYFTEAYPATSKVGGRVFSVLLEGVAVINRLDIFAEAGHDNALIKTFDTAVADGNINITFKHENVEDPEIAAIEILSKDTLVFHTINSSTGNYGTISPQGELKIAQGTSQTYTIAANSNYYIKDVLVDGMSVGALSSYTFPDVGKNHTITAEFALNSYTLISQATEHGTISPVGTQTVTYGSSQEYIIKPASGYHISDVVVDGKSVGDGSTYIFESVTENHTISASFAINKYTLTAKANANGSIAPSGKTSVEHGSSTTYTIRANDHFNISDVRVDGQSMGAISTYTFPDIAENHTIEADFAAKTYQIEAKDCSNGTIAPAGVSNLSSGNSITYSFTSNDDYELKDVKIDGISIGAQNNYTFESVTSNHTVEALFEKRNQSPIADAGPDQNVEEGVEVTLSANNSIDPDDGIAKLLWEQIGEPKVVLSDYTDEEVTFLAPDVGVQGAALLFRLTVTDKAGNKSQDTCIVNVTWINMPPNAATSPDQTIAEGVEVVLNGLSSSDPDDGIKSYQWVQKNGELVSLVNADSAKATFISPVLDSKSVALSFELIVTDNGGLKDTATTVVNITRTNNQPIAEAGPNQTVAGGTEVTLDGSNSIDLDDGISTYIWTQTDGLPVILSDPSAMNPTFIAPAVENGSAVLVFKLTVGDTSGLASQDTCVINLVKDNQVPVADAGPNITVPAGSKVTLDGSGSFDKDDGIVSYQWIQISGPSVTLNIPGSVRTDFIALNSDSDDASLTFKLVVRDAGGLQSEDTVIVNISSENYPPEANAGNDQLVKAGINVVLDGSQSSDPDDGIVSYYWNQVSGPPVTIISPNDIVATFTAPAAEKNNSAIVFTLTVADKGGLKNDDTCIVNIDSGLATDTQAPKVTILYPVNSDVYETNESVISISGSAEDTHGVVKVNWTNSNGGSGIADGTQSWSIDDIKLSEGENVVTVAAEDGAGNSGKTVIRIIHKIRRDTAAPDLRITSPTSIGFYFTLSSKINLKGTCSDDTGVSKITWAKSTGGKGDATGTSNWKIKGMKLKKWFNIVTITATDTAGNISTLDITIFRWPF